MAAVAPELYAAIEGLLGGSISSARFDRQRYPQGASSPSSSSAALGLSEADAAQLARLKEQLASGATLDRLEGYASASLAALVSPPLSLP